MIFNGNTGRFINDSLDIALEDARLRIEYIQGVRPLFPEFGTLGWNQSVEMATLDLDALRSSVIVSLSESTLYELIDVTTSYREQGIVDIRATVKLPLSDRIATGSFSIAFGPSFS